MPGVFIRKDFDPQTGAIIYSVDYTIDANLMRQTLSGESGPTIAFFGDSATFGIGVNDADTMPQAFADSLDRKSRVLNLAFGGYGPQQFLRELETGIFDRAIGLRPKLFIFMTTPLQAEWTACNASWTPRGPRYALEDGRVAFKGTCYEGASLALHEWLWDSASYRTFINPIFRRVTHNDIELYIQILLAAVQLAKEKYGVATLVPYTPVRDEFLAGTGFSNDSIIKRLNEGGASVVDISFDQREVADGKIEIVGDGHPTPAVHRLRAAKLKSFIDAHAPGALFSKQDQSR